MGGLCGSRITSLRLSLTRALVEQTEFVIRLPTILLTMVLGALVFRWGKELWGKTAGCWRYWCSFLTPFSWPTDDWRRPMWER